MKREQVQKVVVQLADSHNFKEFIDEDVCWTNDDGYLRISYGKDLVAEFQPGSWSWVELISLNTDYKL